MKLRVPQHALISSRPPHRLATPPFISSRFVSPFLFLVARFLCSSKCDNKLDSDVRNERHFRFRVFSCIIFFLPFFDWKFYGYGSKDIMVRGQLQLFFFFFWAINDKLCENPFWFDCLTGLPKHMCLQIVFVIWIFSCIIWIILKIFSNVYNVCIINFFAKQFLISLVSR